MNWKQHLFAGTFISIVYAFYLKFPPELFVILVFGGFIGSVLPDVDHQNSKPNNVLEILLAVSGIYFIYINNLIYAMVALGMTVAIQFLRHRKFLHSYVFFGIAGMLCYLFNQELAIGLVIGMLSHKLLDYF